MFFYKLQGVCAEIAGQEDRQVKRELSRKIARGTVDYNSNNSDSFLFVSDIVEDIVTIGLITKDFIHPTKSAKGFAAFLELDIQDVTVDEITLGKMEHLLNTANRCDFIEDDDDVLEQFELHKITGRMGRNLLYGENLTKDEVGKEELLANAKKYFMTETLVPEIERIYAGRKNVKAAGHPVHYIVECDDRDTRREIYKTLLDGLYANYRLDSRRYAFLDFRPGENYSQMAYDVLYKVCRGGAVVVRYLAGDDTEEDGRAGGERETIASRIKLARSSAWER